MWSGFSLSTDTLFELSSFELSAAMRSVFSRDSCVCHCDVLNRMFRFIISFLVANVFMKLIFKVVELIFCAGGMRKCRFCNSLVFFALYFCA